MMCEPVCVYAPECVQHCQQVSREHDTHFSEVLRSALGGLSGSAEHLMTECGAVVKPTLKPLD